MTYKGVLQGVAYMIVAYTGMACIVMAYMIMACVRMACVLMAYIVRHISSAHGYGLHMAYTVMPI